MGEWFNFLCQQVTSSCLEYFRVYKREAKEYYRKFDEFFIMTISVIIPIYKVENYIRRCLESVIEQDSNKFRIECILVDDCTPDKSMEIVKEVVDDYKGGNISFIFLQHGENRGVSAARNTGMTAANGDFLFFLDSDDEIEENALLCLFSCYLKYPYVDVFVGDTYDEERLNMLNVITNDKNYSYVIDDKTVIWKLLLRRQIDRHVWNKLIRRSVVINNKIFFNEHVSLYEDVIWTYKLYAYSSSILILSLMTYKYVNNPLSLIHTTTQRVAQLVESLSIVSDFVYKNPPLINGKIAYYAAHRLFTFHWLMIALEAKEKTNLVSESYSILISLRNALLWDSLKHFRPFLALFYMIMFNPFNKLLKNRWIRSNVYRLEQLAYLLS